MSRKLSRDNVLALQSLWDNARHMGVKSRRTWAEYPEVLLDCEVSLRTVSSSLQLVLRV